MTSTRAADCHAHVFCDRTAYPFAPNTTYMPDPKDRHKVLWDTPARLFGFK